MKRSTLAIGACIAGLGMARALLAQTTPPVPNDAAGDADASAYVDRLIDGGALAPLIVADDGAEDDASGLPRAFRIEAIASVASGDGPFQRENGLAFGAQLDTMNFGALSIDGVLRNEPGGGAISIIQRGMPFDGGWFANNGVGTLYTPSIDLARSQYRFYLPTFPIAGATSEWIRDGQLQLQAAAGEPGIFDGLRMNGFDGLGGSLVSAGAQWNLSSQWQAGVQAVDANAVDAVTRFDGATATGGPVSAQSFYATAAWQGDATRLQANLLQSDIDTGAGAATGAWLDGVTRDGRITHHYGVFRFDPGLSWGYSPVSSDLEGAYYRGSYQSRRWLFDGGIDSVQSISGNGIAGRLYTGSARYQISRDLGVGASLTWRDATTDARSGYLFAEKLNALGAGRVQLDSSAGDNDRYDRLSVSQTWNTPVGMRLTTTAFAGRETIDGTRRTHAGGSLAGGGDLFGNFSWDGSLSIDHTGSANSVGANIGATAQLGRHWSLAATYFDNRNENPDLFATSLIPPPESTVQRNRAVFLTLRYEVRAGTASAPIGGARGAPAGAIAGRLFLDANDNGVQDADEAAAANVTVLLDGRYSTRTDPRGRFEFAPVAAGEHVVQIIADNLPLPWSVDRDGRRAISVRTRETTTVVIAATRLR